MPERHRFGSGSNYWRRTYTQAIYRNNEYSLSDDRIKTNETLVANATETLLKLKPQTYNKHALSLTNSQLRNIATLRAIMPCSARTATVGQSKRS